MRDCRPKFRYAAKKVFKAKQNKATEERLRGANRAKFREKSKPIARKEERKKAKELQWSFANCLRRSAVKTGHLEIPEKGEIGNRRFNAHLFL